MRVNWFSPLAPQRTDIAHYTGRVAAALMERFDVAFWTDLEADPALLPPGALLERFDPADIQGRPFNSRLFGGFNIYNFGNDARFHAGIARVAAKIPGVAVLHDTRLHHFTFEASRQEDPPFASYLAQAQALYGPAGLETARRVIDLEGRIIDEHVQAMPFIEPVLEASLGVICHSAAARDQIPARSDTPILTLPLPFASVAQSPAVSRSSKPPLRLVTYGYINTNRRLESIIQALAGWSDALPFRFDIYGALWNPGLIETLIQRAGLQDRVTLHGFTPEAELDQAIAQAHLAFNLRHPTMGEASGGILRAWSHATPALVTDEGWYADLPVEVAWKISTANELGDIRAALTALSRDPASFASMGRAARARLLALHTPERYVQALAAGLEDMAGLAQRFAARGLLKRMGANGRTEQERRFLLDRACRTIPGLFARAP